PEPGRTAAVADGIPAPLQRDPAAPPRSAARPHRLGPGPRPQRRGLERAVRAGRVVCGPPQLLARHEDTGDDGAPRPEPARRQRRGRGDDARVHGRRTMKNLAIVGAGGHGRVIADAAQTGGWSNVEFYDDAWPRLGARNGPWALRGDMALLLERLDEYDGVIVGIGDNRLRAMLQQRLREAGAPLACVIHPTAIVSRYASLGAGCAVFARAIVNAGAQIGDGVILNSGCTVEH